MIKSMEEVITFLCEQADLRSPENDEAGALRAAAADLADFIFVDACNAARRRNADRIDGYDRDDLGESPDF